MRSDDADEDTPRGAPGGNRKVKRGEVLYTRLQADQFAVTDHAGQEQERRKQNKLPRKIEEDDRQAGPEKSDRKQRMKNRSPVPARIIEAEDEAKKIKRERQHPKQRYGCHLLAKQV